MPKLSISIISISVAALLLYVINIFKNDNSNHIPELFGLLYNDQCPSICWINKEPVIYINSQKLISWIGFPLVKGTNNIEFTSLDPSCNLYDDIELKLGRVGSNSAVNIPIEQGGINFVINDSVNEQMLKPIPLYIDETKIKGFVLKFLKAIESGNRDNVDELFLVDNCSDYFPECIFEKPTQFIQIVNSLQDIAIAKGDKYILVYPRYINKNEYKKLIEIKCKINKFEVVNIYEIYNIIFYYNSEHKLCISTIGSTDLHYSIPSAIRL